MAAAVMVCTSDPHDGRPPQQARVDERPATWVCHCGQAFPTEQQIRAHAGSAHGGNAKVRQLVATKYCPCCLRSFPTRMKLIIHLQYVRKGKAETGCARFLRQEGHAISKEEADRLDKRTRHGGRLRRPRRRAERRSRHQPSDWSGRSLLGPCHQANWTE